MKPGRVVPLAAVAAVLAISLSGCVAFVTPRATVLPAPGPARPTASSSPSATALPSPSVTTGERQDCGGQPVTVAGQGLSFVLVGTCPAVTVSGAGNTVDVAGAVVQTVAINGDRNAVDGASLSAVTVGGQDNEVSAATVQTVTLNGDRNRIGVTGAIGAIVVSGNDNAVTGGALGTVTDSGQRNTIVAR